MKYSWRITKYNPKYRDKYGHYIKDSWTTYSDIGHIHDNILVTIEDYMFYESLYIHAIILFMNYLNLTKLFVTHLWKPEQIIVDKYTTPQMKILLKKIKNNSWINKKDIPNLMSLILRDQLWCQLSYPYNMYIHFGYDFYMYVGVRKPCNEVIPTIEKSGLYIESYKSPYKK